MVIVGPLISAIIAGGTTPSNSSSMADSDCSIFPNVSTAIPSSLTAFELHSQLSYFKAVVGTDNLPNLESILSASRDRQVELIDDSFEHDDEIDDLENEVQLLEELLDDAKIKYKDASQRAKDANTPENIQEMQKREWMVSNAKEELSEAENLKFAYEHDRDWCWAQHREEEMKSERSKYHPISNSVPTSPSTSTEHQLTSFFSLSNSRAPPSPRKRIQRPPRRRTCREARTEH